MEDTLLVLYGFTLDGDGPSFEQEYRRYQPQQRQFPGHLGELLARSPDDPSSYLIVSRWQAAGFHQWLRSPEHDSITAMLDRFGRTGSSVRRYVLVCDESWEDESAVTVAQAGDAQTRG